MRRATIEYAYRVAQVLISIHALREESDGSDAWKYYLDCISIHALREKSDGSTVFHQPLLPISIHALREESDALRIDRLSSEDDFNPRSP